MNKKIKEIKNSYDELLNTVQGKQDVSTRIKYLISLCTLYKDIYLKDIFLTIDSSTLRLSTKEQQEKLISKLIDDLSNVKDDERALKSGASELQFIMLYEVITYLLKINKIIAN